MKNHMQNKTKHVKEEEKGQGRNPIYLSSDSGCLSSLFLAAAARRLAQEASMCSRIEATCFSNIARKDLSLSLMIR